MKQMTALQRAQGRSLCLTMATGGTGVLPVAAGGGRDVHACFFKGCCGWLLLGQDEI